MHLLCICSNRCKFYVGTGVRRSRRLRRTFYSIDTFSYCHVSLPLIPILSAPKPPRMPPEAMPTHMPIMKPIFTLSKQDGCPPPCMAPCGTGMLVWKQVFILIFKNCLQSLSRSAISFAHRLTLLSQRGEKMKKSSVRLPEKASDFSSGEKNLLAISFTLP